MTVFSGLMTQPCAFRGPVGLQRARWSPLTPGEITSTVVLTLAPGASGIRSGQTSNDEREDVWERLCVYDKHRGVQDKLECLSSVARLI